MLKLATIGTSWICRQFIDAAIESGHYDFKAVYSRSKEKGQEFTADFSNISIFDDLESFVQFEETDVIYIASPNSLHFSQAKAAVEAGKHVIVEKPAFSNPKEFAEIFKLAKEKGLFVLEAARHIHDPAFQLVKDFLSEKEVIGANLTYAKYSSKMPALLAGELPNKWNAKFSGGILADLGVYLVYWALGQFGKPESVHYSAQLLPSGVDVSGNGFLRYSDFDVSIHCAGNLTSYLPSEIYTRDGTLILDSVSGTSFAEFTGRDGSAERIELEPAENPLFDEAKTFGEIISSGNKEKYEACYELARLVNESLFEMRKEAGIHFDAD